MRKPQTVSGTTTQTFRNPTSWLLSAMKFLKLMERLLWVSTNTHSKNARAATAALLILWVDITDLGWRVILPRFEPILNSQLSHQIKTKLPLIGS
ncbi:MAG: hypothetical protein A2945_03495 [Candidatus Liptonbacteria bacterium RIFCSPLOWO2_01_FULL_52_25]|uniref:Uncharacterized protein n=1 Tax=Candidatus Liptonbacteria bacterium RIFCSPLOWO2_01_FULL_52_25 TaxID=1798650 RepID=A0A1G2CG72_9BACT|nr:MAG: hypothetical protein A2945_03495 [Candidatus Liptonbacteria bacterium RIFCSPLOWO2_01_FULL_52_25]